MIVWKTIAECPDYDVSNTGVVKRIVPNKRGHRLPIGGKILVSRPDKDGYLKVTLFWDGSPKSRRVHRLVAEAFIPNPLALPEVNHGDGVKSNNRVGNLEWATSSTNNQHAFDTGLKKPVRGSKNGWARLTTKDVQRMRQLYAAGVSIRTLAERFDVGVNTAHRAATGRSWIHA